MPLSSMTGFARAHGSHGNWRWHWEVRSVNAKGLDIRVRVPEGFESLEQPARILGNERFSRGNVSASLTLDSDPGKGGIRINREALQQILGVMRELEGEVTAGPATLDGILSLRGVIEAQPALLTEQEQAARDAALLKSLASALDALALARREEGARLHNVLQQQAARLGVLVGEAEQWSAGQPDLLRQRLKAGIDQILGSHPGLSEDRIAQEVAVLLVRSDVREEIDRLKSHLVQAQDLFGGKGAQGRRFDFLAQELNREANTLCSKSSDIQLTRIGLEMKATIDQLREQVQNVE
jgi:uncharacterized protein (TIGR00255 family)